MHSIGSTDIRQDMKENTNKVYTAILAVAVLVFVGCSADEDLPTRSLTDDNTAVQLSLSLGTSTAATRMNDNVIQEEGHAFRGIDNIMLIPFRETAITGTTKKAGDFIDMATMLKPTEQNVFNSLPAMTARNTALYEDVYLPVKTGGFLFYGKATQPAMLSGDTEYNYHHRYGRLNIKLGSSSYVQANDLHFALEGINSRPDTEKARSLANYMTTIATAQIGTSRWDEYNHHDELYSLWQEFSGNKAGASLSIQALLQDLYNRLTAIADPLTSRIIKAIKEGADIDEQGTLTLKSNLSGYPSEIGLPDGAAYIEWDDDNKKFVEQANKSNIGYQTANLSDYVYPPCLYYFVNSSILISNETQQDKYNGDNDWETIKQYYAAGTVAYDTKAVAIAQPVQYAVGRFDVTVKCKNAELNDHNDAPVSVPTAGFPVTAVFIGGQKYVDWKFEQVNTKKLDSIIYDNQVSISAKAGIQSEATHTLVLETAADQSLSIAIELENNTGRSFTGYNGQMVYAGSKFYLVGRLAPKAGKKVFEQDCKTVANLEIESLGNAYNVIPDLRAPHLELGVSVVSSWSSAGIVDLPLE